MEPFFVWSVNPLPLDVYDTAKLQALYKEGSAKYTAQTLQTAYRQILTAVYKGHVGPLQIPLEPWIPEVHLNIIDHLKKCFPSLEISCTPTYIQVNFPIVFQV
jgi:hypothetical protein